MTSPTLMGLALAGQSNALANNGDTMIGVPMCFLQSHNYSNGGAYAAGLARGVQWWTEGAAAPDRVCPGAGVAEQLASRDNVGLRICKDAVGGSAISTWISTYGPRHVATMQATGWAFDLGLIWVQGEYECANAGQAASYQASLETLMALYWAAFPTLKVCVVKVSSSFVALGTGLVPDHISTVRAAQDAFGAAHPSLVTVIEGLPPGGQWDGVHGTGPQNRTIGAAALAALEAL